MSVEWGVVMTPHGPMIALTPQQFERLSYNLSELVRWIEEANWRLRYYDAP